MKITSVLKRDHYAARVSIFLVVLALIAPIAGCVQSAPYSYDLTIASTTGGSVTVPGEGTSTYDEGTVVNLVAAPDTGYRFVSWTGGVGVVGNANAESTTIVMNDTYSIAANFAKLQYDLTTTSTFGGAITVPGESTFIYDIGSIVNLEAEAEEGYEFVSWSGDVGTIEDIHAAHTAIVVQGSYSITANFERGPVPMVAGGCWHTLGLKSDGTVVAVGYDSYGQCSVGNWTEIIQVDGGGEHTVGLRSDGTVVAVGYNAYGQCNVDSWSDIIQVVAGRQHTAGLRSDGTVVAVGLNAYGQCNVGNWTDIIQIAAGANSWHTVGLKSDGSVVAVGGNWDGECDLGDWTGIIQVAAGGHHTVGLTSTGTVVAAGSNDYRECDVSNWIDVVQIAAGCQLTVALRSDGTVVTAGWNDYGQRGAGGWTNISQVAAGMIHTIGLRTDGSVVTAGNNYSGQGNVGDWILT